MNTEYPENGQQTRLSRQGRDRIKRLLTTNQDGDQDYLQFETRCVQEFGLAAGRFLRQAVYWTGKSTILSDGGIAKSQPEWWEELGLTRRNVDTARDKLREAGVLKEGIWEAGILKEGKKLKGVPPKVCYWVDLVALAEILEIPISLEASDIEQFPPTLNPDSMVSETSKLDIQESAPPESNMLEPSELTCAKRASHGERNERVDSIEPGKIFRDSLRDSSKDSFKDSDLQSGEPDSSSRSAPTKNKGEDQESRSSGGDTSPNNDAIPSSLTPQEESAREPVEGESPPDIGSRHRSKLDLILDEPPENLIPDLERYRAGELELEALAEKVARFLVGTNDWGEVRNRPWVLRRALEVRALEEQPERIAV